MENQKKLEEKLEEVSHQVEQMRAGLNQLIGQKELLKQLIKESDK